MKKPLSIIILLFIFVISLTSCGPSTRIVNSWRDSSVAVNVDTLHKFVVAALLKNEAVRRATEDKMAALNPGKAVQSYLLFGTQGLKENDNYYMKKLKDEGYNGVVIMRILKVDKDSRYVQGTYPAYYGSWRGYYGVAWGGYYDPGYYTTDKTFYVEVTVFSLPRDRLVWTGTTATINPASGDELFTGVINSVQSKMINEGFLVKGRKK
ncbi:MAG: hypothetical protein ACHQEM_06335 [Chitinophagales bacterium]